MRPEDSAIARIRPPLHGRGAGLWWGALGVIAFSFTMPFTRVAVEDGAMSPLFVGSARAVLAAVLAGAALAVTRQRVPRGTQWVRVGIVAAGAVVGFPLLTSYALTGVPASHGAVVVALLPAMTAVMAVVRAGERPRPWFWVAAGVGALAAVSFAALQHGGLGAAGAPDLLLFAAVIVCAIAYAEGGLLSRELGSWQTISWALVLAAPLMLVLTGIAVVDTPPEGTAREWAALAYLGVISMFLGFVAWYRGLAIGPIARVGQVQLAQPVLSIVWAGLILHEPITWTTIVGGAVVVACALLAVRTRGSAAGRPAAGIPSGVSGSVAE
ncbi:MULTISPECIES: DMT family transporter [Microbacterium]|uniref:DMT family transporter n=1 Tax=Microbacterium wangchenii TaxID=2541726 RepID=A0ABX5SW07_9MICO|nr:MULTISPECIES: DMT family transporter [Microbacterium]MCK6065591.1 DMT family transporter [Microbacterium sp. EYE_512]QBR89014.1 DMT family transporter [Microbacterium wangchenii]TXK20735.1 DMT family transporter [Microbacterium wangchenii]